MQDFNARLEHEIDELELQAEPQYREESPDAKNQRREREFLIYDALQYVEKAKKALTYGRARASSYALKTISVIETSKAQSNNQYYLYGDSKDLQEIKINLARLEKDKKIWDKQIEILKNKIDVLQKEIHDDEQLLSEIMKLFKEPVENSEKYKESTSKFRAQLDFKKEDLKHNRTNLRDGIAITEVALLRGV